MGCRISKLNPEETAAGAATSAGIRCDSSNTMCTFSPGSKRREGMGRFWRRGEVKAQREDKPEVIEKHNKVVAEKEYGSKYNGASPSFRVYCLRSASVSSTRPTGQGNRSEGVRETKTPLEEGSLSSDKRSESQSAGKKERSGRGVRSFFKVSWRKSHGHKHALKLTT